MAFVPQGGRVRFVLVEPSHAGNIGSAARAINTMGFSHLYVVNPREPNYKHDPEALSFCTRSADVLEASVCVPDLQSERSGLTNEEVNQCQRCVGIPANPACDSLNLAQAVQVTAYQLQTELRGDALSKESCRFIYGEPASAESVEKMFQHLQQAMLACGALDLNKPKLMMQRFRHLFSRAGLTQTEVDLLRGVYASIIRSKEERRGSKKL